MIVQLASAFAMAVLLAGCAQGSSPSTRPSVPAETPASAWPSAAPTEFASLDGALILRAYSGPFQDDSQRTMTVLPEVVVFADGRVAADVSPYPDSLRRHYKTIQLSDQELATILNLLDDRDVGNIPLRIAPDFASSDGAVAIIQASTPDKGDIEMAVLGLDTRIQSESASAHYPEIAIRLDGLLSGLWERADAEGMEWVGELPQVRVARQVGG